MKQESEGTRLAPLQAEFCVGDLSGDADHGLDGSSIKACAARAWAASGLTGCLWADRLPGCGEHSRLEPASRLQAVARLGGQQIIIRIPANNALSALYSAAGPPLTTPLIYEPGCPFTAEFCPMLPSEST